MFLVSLSIQTLQWQLEEVLMSLGWGEREKCGFLKSLFSTSLTKQTISTLLTQNNKSKINYSCSSTLFSIVGVFFRQKWKKSINEHSFHITVDLVPVTFWVTLEMLEGCCKQSYRKKYSSFIHRLKVWNTLIKCLWFLMYELIQNKKKQSLRANEGITQVSPL